MLIRRQVGNWCSFINVFRDILSNGHELCLICEDDIQFTDNHKDVFNSLLSRDTFASYGIDDASPLLIGIGRSYCQDHVYNGDCHFVTDIKMSNPCFMLNSEMARVLLGNLEEISETSDMYIHDTILKMDKTVQCFNAMPSPVYELSTSKFKRFDSEIHPEGAAGGNCEKAIKPRLRLEYRDLLCIGHSQCGMGYVSFLLSRLDLDVGHEVMLENGVASWMYAVDDSQYPGGVLGSESLSDYYFEHVIHVVRDPFEAIPKILLEHGHAPNDKAYLFRQKHVESKLGIMLGDYDSTSSFEVKMSLAVESFVYWNHICERNTPDLVIRVESDQDKLVSYVKRYGIIEDERGLEASVHMKEFTDSEKWPCQERGYEPRQVSLEDYERVPESLLKVLREWCSRYGYECCV